MEYANPSSSADVLYRLLGELPESVGRQFFLTLAKRKGKEAMEQCLVRVQDLVFPVSNGPDNSESIGMRDEMNVLLLKKGLTHEERQILKQVSVGKTRREVLADGFFYASGLAMMGHALVRAKPLMEHVETHTPAQLSTTAFPEEPALHDLWLEAAGGFAVGSMPVWAAHVARIQNVCKVVGELGTAQRAEAAEKARDINR